MYDVPSSVYSGRGVLQPGFITENLSYSKVKAIDGREDLERLRQIQSAVGEFVVDGPPIIMVLGFSLQSREQLRIRRDSLLCFILMSTRGRFRW